MENLKKRWEIKENWQLIHVVLGLIATFFCGYLIAKAVLKNSLIADTPGFFAAMIFGTLLISFIIYKLTIWLFSKLYDRWGVTYRWELIAIFLVFAITGSSAGRLSNPLMELLGLDRALISGWIYWPVRILLIFPIYQVLLVIFGWIFGQFTFFRAFAIKMVSRMGFGFLFKTTE